MAPPLHIAAFRGKVDICETLLQHGADLRARDSHGRTALHYASEEDQASLARWILDQKLVDVNGQDNDGNTALHMACWRGNEETIHVLVEEGADMNCANKNGKTPLHLSLIQKHQANMNCTNEDGKKLHESIEETRRKHARILQYLQERDSGRPPERQGTNGSQDAQSRKSFLTTFKQDSTGVEPIDGADGNTSCHTAVWYGDQQVFQHVVKKRRWQAGVLNQRGRTPLHLAALKGRVGMVKVLLAMPYVDPNAADQDGNTPLHLAVSQQHLEKTHILVQYGDVHPRNKQEETPRHIACRIGDAKITEYLQGVEELLANKRMRHADSSVASDEEPMLVQEGENSLDETTNLSTSTEDETESEGTPRPAKTCQVFLNHTGRNPAAATFVAFLEDALTTVHRVDSFLDSRLHVGDDVLQEIEEYARRCEVFVAVYCREYTSRYWTMHELDLAMQSGCKIVPVFYGSAPGKVNWHTKRKLGGVMKKELGYIDRVVLDRWCQNLRRLDNIVAAINYSNHKHSVVEFRDSTVETILSKLA